MSMISRRAVVVTAALPAVIFGAAPSASADGGGGSWGGPGSGASGHQSGVSGQGAIAAQVKLDTSHNGHAGASPVTPSNSSWPPPLCWMQPKWSGKQYKQNEEETALKDPKTGKPIPGQDKGFNYHEHDKGAWWELTFDVDRLNSGVVRPGEPGKCSQQYQPAMRWVPYRKPKPPGAISPLVLSGQAFKAMKLPAPPVKLSPPPSKQKVNFPLRAKFRAPLKRYWVTARFQAHGVNIAATTVAEPTSLRIDAGTTDADPQSCTYDLTKAGGGYRVDTKGADCRIKYRKGSGSGTYPLKAQVQWKVKWTDSDDPDGPAQKPALPNGLSSHQQPVTVKEIQSVVQ